MLLYHWLFRSLRLGRHERRDQSHPLCKESPVRGTFRYSRASGRPEPGNGCAKGFLHLPEGCIILVALSGPKEAFEAILAMAGHEVDMHMRDALADTVVDCDKRSIVLYTLF